MEMTSKAHEETPWRCPQCGATFRECGGGACLSRRTSCGGLGCDCGWDDEASNLEDHGLVHSNPCHNANCYHCGWGGTLPAPIFDPIELEGWAKTAWAAGWKPPAGWSPK